MYLREIYIENNGSLESFTATFDLTKEGLPKPIVLVGENGSGKTNLLSIITDALFEGASNFYDNVLPQQGQKRSYFRTIGYNNISSGKSGTVALLNFVHEGASRLYLERAGQTLVSDLKERAPSVFHPLLNWKDDDNAKSFQLKGKTAEAVFENGIYCHFPANRSEIPYWLNSGSQVVSEFSLEPNYSGRLRKPIYVDQAVDGFAQWLMGVMADSRTKLLPPSEPGKSWSFFGDPSIAMMSAPNLQLCDQILGIILDDPDVSFVWLGRKATQKVGIQKQGRVFVPNLCTQTCRAVTCR